MWSECLRRKGLGRDSGGLGDLTCPFGLVKYWHTKDHQNISLEFDPSHKGT